MHILTREKYVSISNNLRDYIEIMEEKVEEKDKEVYQVEKLNNIVVRVVFFMLIVFVIRKIDFSALFKQGR